MKRNSNAWYDHTDFKTFAKAVKETADKHTAWLDQIDCKYLLIRVDMRTGSFHVSNAQGHTVDNLRLHKLLNLERPE